MAKDPARVAAGKKAWRNMSAAKKSKILAALKRGRAKSSGTTRTSKSTSSRAHAKSSTKKKGQNILTMIMNLSALAAGTYGIWGPIVEYHNRRWRIGDALKGPVLMSYIGGGLDSKNRWVWRPEHLARGWGAMGGAIAWRKLGQEVAKHAPINRRMSLFNKATSVFARIMHLVPVGLAVKDAFDSGNATTFGHSMVSKTTGIVLSGGRFGSDGGHWDGNWQISELAVGYGTGGAGIAIKKGLGVLAKAVPSPSSSISFGM